MDLVTARYYIENDPFYITVLSYKSGPFTYDKNTYRVTKRLGLWDDVWTLGVL